MKNLLPEMIDPLTPKNVRFSKKIHNKGTNLATLLKKFSYNTISGNKVEIICKQKSEDNYEISFLVNGNIENDKTFFDRDVLRTVFTLLPKIADKLNMKTIFIESYSDEGDKKILKNFNGDDLLSNLIDVLEESLLKYENVKKGVNFNSSIYKQYEQEIYKFEYFLNFLKNKNNFIWDFKNNEKLTFYFKNDELETAYNKYRLFVLSNSEQGVEIKKNRRHSIYKNLLPKFMTDWDIKEYKLDDSSGFFILERKK